MQVIRTAAPPIHLTADPNQLEVRNLTVYRGQEFEDYLQMPGISYSTIKGFSGPPTLGMQLGTRIHNYLNEPHLYDWQQVEIVKPVAAEIRAKLGPAFKYMEKELAFTAEFHYQGLVMLYKGRIDAGKLRQIVVDYKILASGLEGAVTRFGYDRQLSGYCLATGTPRALIIAWNKSKKQVETKLITPDAEFWKYQVVRFGKPA